MIKDSDTGGNCSSTGLTRRGVLSGALALPLASAGVQAQSGWPNRVIRMVVPYPPGGGTDVIARIVKDPLGTALGTTILIDNRGGAAGALGTELVAKAPADGYTLLFTLSSHTINPGLYVKLPFDTEKDFASISQVASLPQILVANTAFAANSLQDLVALAKAKPRSINYGSVGAGSPSHICGEMLDLSAGTRMQHIPYRGGGPALLDLLGGQIPVLWVSIPAVAEQVKSGRIKALAVSTKKRSALLPTVPTVAEAGYPDFEVDSWYAMFAPKGTPREVIDAVQRALAKVVKEPETAKALLAQGAEGVGSTSAQLDAIVQAEIPKWGDIIRKANIKPE